MSGGRWDYVYGKFYDTAERLKQEKCSYRRALGTLVEKVGQAMHDIEWVDSGDMSEPDEMPAIKAALGHQATLLALDEVIANAKGVQAELAMLITDAEAQRGG